MKHNDFYMDDIVPVLQEVIASGGEFLLYPKGTSMMPLLVEGRDAVVLSALPDSGPSLYDIVLYLRDDGHYVLHRIVGKEESGSFVLCGDNQSILEYGIQVEQCLAVVTRIHRRNQTVLLDSFRYRTYVYWHNKKFPRRFYLLTRSLKSKMKSVFCR